MFLKQKQRIDCAGIISQFKGTAGNLKPNFFFFFFTDFHLQCQFVEDLCATIIGYSLNDSIVVFDRARENLKSSKAYEDYEATINLSINQSLSRTTITSVTTLLVVLALFVFGGESMKNFAFALIVGVIAGTYSSMFVASALVVDWHRLRPEKMKKI